MRQPVFADTFYWQALIDRADAGHPTAVRAAVGLARTGTPLVTTHEVLLELANAFSRDRRLRRAVVDAVGAVRSDSRVTVVSPSLALFNKGWRLYRDRMDKGYSLTDCISMEVMRDGGIQHVLTVGRHFRQAGFTLLF